MLLFQINLTYENIIQFDGQNRSYIIHLPTKTNSQELPLVLVLHGGGGSGKNVMKQTHFNEVADSNGFIVVYPNGTGHFGFLTWNAGSCCGYAKKHNVDDVEFIKALILELERKYPIDKNRIYAVGFSNGGMMTYRLACEMSDVFSAIGVVSGTLTYDSCNPKMPVSIIHIHGTDDENVPLYGGVGKKSIDKAPKRSVIESINFWVKHNNLSQIPETTHFGNILKYRYYNQNTNVEVVLYLIKGGGHAWPGGEQILPIFDKPTNEISASKIIWEFFSKQLNESLK